MKHSAASGSRPKQVQDMHATNCLLMHTPTMAFSHCSVLFCFFLQYLQLKACHCTKSSHDHTLSEHLIIYDISFTFASDFKCLEMWKAHYTHRSGLGFHFYSAHIKINAHNFIFLLFVLYRMWFFNHSHTYTASWSRYVGDQQSGIVSVKWKCGIYDPFQILCCCDTNMALTTPTP